MNFCQVIINETFSMLFSKQEKVKKFKTIPYVMIKILSSLSCLMFLWGFLFRSPQCADDKWTNIVLTESSNGREIFFISALRVTLRESLSCPHLSLFNHRQPKLTSREKANDYSWTRHALWDSVLTYERNRWKFEHAIRNSMGNEIWSIYND